MFKKITKLPIIFLLLLIKADIASADHFVVSSSAKLERSTNITTPEIDNRVLKLRLFLHNKNSPMQFYSQQIVNYADKHKLDYRLLPAIAGVESSFGKRMPTGSYNAYGWSNGKYQFSSWDESFEIVSHSLREKYIDYGLNSIDKIARVYAPPSNTWAGKVKYFMYQIDASPIEFAN